MSGWDDLLGIYKDASAEQAAAPDLSDCPVDGYPLEATPRGAHCGFCGWTDGYTSDGS